MVRLIVSILLAFSLVGCSQSNDEAPYIPAPSVSKTAAASTPESRFIEDINEQGSAELAGNRPGSLIKTGRGICEKTAQGVDFIEMTERLERNGLSERDSVVLVTLSYVNLCPNLDR